jgi:murein DD-endopeptidase MepM/ murein hydrolase activator NlpD
MPRRWSAVALAVVLTGWAAPAAAGPPHRPPAPGPPAEGGLWAPPADGPVVRSFEPPARPFGPRHLGLDYAVPPGTPVRAAGDGVVVFAGRAGRTWAVAVEHPGARRTTYAYLRRIRVTAGWPVRLGAVLGESGGTGPGHGPGVVHFGYRVGGQAQDPAPLFTAPRPRFSLVPLDRPACRAPLGGPAGPPATLGGNPTPPGRESTRPR